jgi:hypothetical protein
MAYPTLKKYNPSDYAGFADSGLYRALHDNASSNNVTFANAASRVPGAGNIDAGYLNEAALRNARGNDEIANEKQRMAQWQKANDDAAFSYALQKQVDDAQNNFFLTLAGAGAGYGLGAWKNSRFKNALRKAGLGQALNQEDNMNGISPEYDLY